MCRQVSCRWFCWFKSAIFRPYSGQICRFHLTHMLFVTFLSPCPAAGPGLASPSSIYDFSALQYEQEVPLSKYKGQVLVIVNIASE